MGDETPFFTNLKKHSRTEAAEHGLPIFLQGNEPALLVPVGPWILDEPDNIEKMAFWRSEAREWFLVQFESTPARTENYLREYSLADPTRLLFLLEVGDEMVGHIGLANLTKHDAELDNVMKSPRSTIPGLMDSAARALLDWAFSSLPINSIHLRVTSHNHSARNLYTRLGFVSHEKLPLRVEHHGDVTFHIPAAPHEADADFDLEVMRLERKWFMAQPAVRP